MDAKEFFKYLLEHQYLTKAQLQECAQLSQIQKQKIDQILIQKAYLTREQFTRAHKEFLSIHKATICAPQPIFAEEKTVLDEKVPSVSDTVKIPKNGEATLRLSPRELSTALESTQGKKIGKYEILEKIGQGGMGVVYKVRHTDLDQIYALKSVIFAGNASSEELQRFQREAKLLAQLKHPGIVQVIDFGSENEQQYLVMEYVDGTSLDQWIQKKLPFRQGVEILQKCLLALYYAHRKGIIHRDLKPGNIFITLDKEPKIGDFGLAKDIHQEQSSQQLTKTGQIMGTPAYMAPEQAAGEISKVDAQSDIYSIGACLYKMITQHAPFEGNTVVELFYKIVTEEPKPPSSWNPEVPKDLELIILKALSKNKQKRYRSAKLFAEDLDRFLKGQPITAKAVGSSEKLIRKLKKNQQSVIVGISVFFVCILGVLIYHHFLLNNNNNTVRTTTILLQDPLLPPRNVNDSLKEFEEKIQQLKSGVLKEEDFETLLWEIAKMPEKEIVQKIIEFLNEGTEYFLRDQNRQLPLDHFYLAVPRILNRMKNTQTADSLYQSLVKLSNSIANLPETQRSEIHINYLCYLSEALGNCQKGEYTVRFHQIRTLMGYQSLFWKRTESITKKFPVQETIHNSQSADECYNLGILKQAQNDLDGALKFFTQAIQLNPKMTNAYFNRGLIYYYLKNYADALQDMNETIRLEPNSDAYLNRGLLKVALKDLDGALQDYQEAIRLNPVSAHGYCGLGNLRYDRKEWNESLTAFTRAIQLKPKLVEAYRGRGVVKEILGDLQGAIEDLNQAILFDPNFVNAYNSRGLVKTTQKKFTEAVADYTKALAINPSFMPALLNRASAKQEQGDLKSALLDLNEVVRLHSREFSGYHNRGILREKMGDMDGAIQDFTICLTLAPSENSQSYFYRGRVKHYKNDLEGATKDYSRSIALNPKQSFAYMNRGAIRKVNKDLKGAVEDFSSAIQFDPKYDKAYYSRAEIFKETGYLKEALSDYTQALTHNKDTSILLKIYYGRASVKERLNDFDGALTDIAKILETNPNEVYAHFNRGNLLQQKKQYPEALAALDIVLKMDDQFSLAYYVRGSIYYNHNKLELAQKDFQHYLKQSKNLSDAQTTEIRQWILKKFPDLTK